MLANCLGGFSTIFLMQMIFFKNFLSKKCFFIVNGTQLKRGVQRYLVVGHSTHYLKVKSFSPGAATGNT
jgi:hypothetical protein